MKSTNDKITWSNSPAQKRKLAASGGYVQSSFICLGGRYFNLVHILLNQDELNYHMMSLLVLWPVPIAPHCQNCVHVSSLVHLSEETKSEK